MKGCNALKAIALTTSLLTVSGAAHSESSHPFNCDRFNPDSADLTQQLACYHSELDNLSAITGSLLAERQRLSALLQKQTGSGLTALSSNNDQIKEQQLTIEKLRQERSSLSAELHHLKLTFREQQLSRDAEDKLTRNYTQAYLLLANKNAALNAKINSLNESITEKQALTSKLKKQMLVTVAQARQSNDQQSLEIKRLMDEIASVNTAAAQAEQKHQNQAAILTKEIAALRHNRDTLSHQLEAADKLLAEQNESIANLRSQLADTSSFSDTLQTDNNTFRQQIAELGINNSTLMSDVGDLQILQSELRTELGQLLDENDQIIEDKATTLAASESMVDINKSLRTKLAAATQSLTTRITELSNENSTLKSKANQLQGARVELQTKLHDLQKEYDQVTSNNAFTLAAGESMADINKNLRTRLAASTQLLTARITELGNESKTLKSKVNELQTLRSALQTKLQNLQDENDRIINSSASTQAANESMTEVNNTLRAQMATTMNALAGRIIELGIENSNLESGMNELQTQHGKLRTKLDGLQDENKQFINYSANTLAASESMADINKALRAKLTTTAQSLADSEAAKLEANTSLATLNKKVGLLEALLSESQGKQEAVASSLATIKDELSASNNRLNDQQSELSGLLQEKESIVDSLNKINRDTTALVQNIEQKLQGTPADSGTIAVSVQPDNTIVLNVAANQLFRVGSSKLSDEGQQLLASVATALTNSDSRRILIEGHSDNLPLGPKLSKIFTDNVGLSLQRALNAANFLNREAGIPARQLSVSGAGADTPVASNDTAAGRQKNRRVEIQLLPLKTGF